jgi:hypothetical protein
MMYQAVDPIPDPAERDAKANTLRAVVARAKGQRRLDLNRKTVQIADADLGRAEAVPPSFLATDRLFRASHR